MNLKALHKEATFWVLLMISGPGILAAYQSALSGNPPDWTALMASPIAVYLGIGRQYARGKVAEANGRAGTAEPDIETNAPNGAGDPGSRPGSSADTAVLMDGQEIEEDYTS